MAQHDTSLPKALVQEIKDRCREEFGSESGVAFILAAVRRYWPRTGQRANTIDFAMLDAITREAEACYPDSAHDRMIFRHGADWAVERQRGKQPYDDAAIAQRARERLAVLERAKDEDRHYTDDMRRRHDETKFLVTGRGLNE